MRTSLSEIAEIEKHLAGEHEPPEALLFQAKMLTNPTLKYNVYVQKKIHTLVRLYHLKQLKAEVEQIHQQLFNDPTMRSLTDGILQLFKS